MPSKRLDRSDVAQMYDAFSRLSNVFISLAMLLYVQQYEDTELSVEAATQEMLEGIQVDDAEDPATKAAAMRLYQEAVNMTVDRLAPRFEEVAELQEKGEADGDIPRYGW